MVNETNEMAPWEHTYERWAKYGAAAEKWALHWKRRTISALQIMRTLTYANAIYLVVFVSRQMYAPRQKKQNKKEYFDFLAECDFYFPLGYEYRRIISGKKLIPDALEIKNPLPHDWWHAREEEAKNLLPTERKTVSALANTWYTKWAHKTEEAFLAANSRRELDIAFRRAQSAKFAYALEWLGEDIKKWKRYSQLCDEKFNLAKTYEDYARRKGFLATVNE